MQKYMFGLVACLALSLLAPAQRPAASSSPGADQQARAIVRRALEKLGGSSALQKTGGLALSAEGAWDAAAELQGKSPAAANPVKFSETLVLDLTQDRLGYEPRKQRYDGSSEWIRFVYLKRDQMLFTHLDDRFAFHGQGREFAENRARLARMIPQMLLGNVLENDGGLRLLKRRTLHGQSHDAVSCTLKSGETLTLFFSARDGLLRGFEQLVDMPLRGDTAVRWEYADYRPVAGLGLYPGGYRIRVGNRTLKELRYTRLQTTAVSQSEIFTLPAGITPPKPPAPPPVNAPPPAPRKPRLTQVAPGVWFVANLRAGAHTLFVEFDEYLMAFDAPAGYLEFHQIPAADFVPGATSSSITEEFIRLMKETVPNKPIKYVALTHFHSDHIGGIRAFIAEGATILTTPQTRRLIGEAARAPFTLNPDRQTQQPQAPKFELVSGKHRISDGKQTVELLEVGANPHADEVLVMHLPRDGFVYVADLFESWSLNGKPSASHLPLLHFFVNWLDQRGLKPVKVYGAHGAGAATPEHLERLRALRASATPNPAL